MAKNKDNKKAGKNKSGNQPENRGGGDMQSKSSTQGAESKSGRQES